MTTTDELQDIELENDRSHEDDHPVRYNVSSYGWDTDVEGLVKRLTRDDIYVPAFQRKFVWNTADKSRFIESLILGLPVPSLFLATDPDTKKMNIVDGQQRLLSLKQYFDGEFALNATDIQDDLKGRFYATSENRKTSKVLSEPDRRTLENALLHAVVIKQEPNTEVETHDYNAAIIQIFKRLNTSGKPLQAQEVRACIFHGRFNSLIGALNQNDDWRQIFGPEHSRLKDVESILRFFALFDWWKKYKAPMPKFLNTYMENNRNITEDQATEYADIFITTISRILSTLGQNAFKPGTTFQISKFDAVMVGLATALRTKDLSDEQIIARHAELLNNDDYKYATEEFVNDTDRVEIRIRESIQIFAA